MLRRFGSGLPPKLSKVLRPMTSGLPAVVARKCAMSDFSRQRRRLSRPIAPFAATAATRTMGVLAEMTWLMGAG